jgi:hypothetical protein
MAVDAADLAVDVALHVGTETEPSFEKRVAFEKRRDEISEKWVNGEL